MVPNTLAIILLSVFAIQGIFGCIYEDSFGKTPKNKEEYCGSDLKEECIESFNSVDLNGDGLVNCQEISVAALIAIHFNGETDKESAFCLRDFYEEKPNDCAKIDVESLLECIDNSSVKTIVDLFQADENSDEKLSCEESIKGLKIVKDQEFFKRRP